jgi:hypothetical protein
MNYAFAALLTAGAAYFLLRRRTFDLFAVAFGGCAFYFFPLLVGHVPDWNGHDPFANGIPLSVETHAIGVGFTAAVLCAAVAFDLRSPRSEIRSASQVSLANWYLLFALIGLIGAMQSGKLFNLNKTFVLTQLGYWFVLFETAAAMAWIDAFLCRRYVQLTAATAFLIVDLVVGFRMMTVMVFIAYMLLKLGSQGRISLWRKLPFLGLAVVGMFLFLLTVNSFRALLLPRLGMEYTELTAPPAAVVTAASPDRSQPPLPAAQPKTAYPESNGIATEALGIAKELPRLIEQMEPFVTQAILSETTRQNFTCAPMRIANVALVVPLAGKFLGSPTTFESEFKPALFPNYLFGMAGNIWAEMFCGFGYAGVAVETLLILSALIGIQFLLFRSRSSAIPALTLSSIFLAFYVHRNDMLFELLLIRRTALVFAMAWLLRAAYSSPGWRTVARQIITGLPKPTG